MYMHIWLHGFQYADRRILVNVYITRHIIQLTVCVTCVTDACAPGVGSVLPVADSSFSESGHSTNWTLETSILLSSSELSQVTPKHNLPRASSFIIDCCNPSISKWLANRLDSSIQYTNNDSLSINVT